MGAERKRVVVVSGAGSGIGAAAIGELERAGFATVGIDLAPAPDSLAGGADLHWLQDDVVEDGTWERAVALAHDLDPAGAWAFVSCAADVTVAPFLTTPPEEWRRLFEINVIGVVKGIQALLPAMIERGAGAMAITCSVGSLFVEEQISAYTTSKSALLAVARSAALEHAADGVRINAVCPGIVDTPLLRKHLESLDEPAAAAAAMRRRMPTGELTEPEEVARLLRFLVSEDATGLSGAAIVVDGGLTSTYDFGSS